MLSAVASGEVDFGLNFNGAQESDITFEPLLEDRFVAACRRDHPLARKRRVSWVELARFDTIGVNKVSGNRLLLDQALAQVAGRLQSIYEVQHVTTQIGIVEAGLGVAAVPSLAMPAADHPLAGQRAARRAGRDAPGRADPPAGSLTVAVGAAAL